MTPSDHHYEDLHTSVRATSDLPDVMIAVWAQAKEAT